MIPYRSVEEFDALYDSLVAMIVDKDFQMNAQKELTEKRDLQFRDLRSVMKIAKDAARFRFRTDPERRKRYA